MRQIAVTLLAVLATGSSGSLALAQSEAKKVATETEESQTSDRTISEEAFLEPLLHPDSPWIRSLGEALGARRADVAKARWVDAPELGAVQEDLGSGGTETEASLSWQIPRPDRRRLDFERASQAMTAAESSFARSVLDLQLDLRRAYADWALATRRIEVLEAEANLLAELVRRSAERGQVGEASGMEVRRIRLAEMEARARAAVARSALATARAKVAGLRPDLFATGNGFEPIAPELAPPPTSAPPTPPAVAALEAEVRAAELAWEVAGKVADMPLITLGWKRVEPDASGPTLDGPVIGLSWPVPLPGRGRAERLRTESRMNALEARLDVLRSRYQAELRSAEASYSELRDAASDAEAALVDTEPVVRAARESFRLGEGDLTTLLDAVRTATAAQMAALELLSHALERQRELERVRGQSFTYPDLAKEIRSTEFGRSPS